MAKTIIHLQGVKFTYPGAQRPTLDIVDLQVAEGQRVFIYGPSGTGKTTMLEVLSGVLLPQQGVISIAGVDLMSLSPTERDQFRAEKMGYVFQSFNLLPFLNVRENIELPLRLRGSFASGGGQHQGFLNHLVENLGLVAVLNQQVTQLSVGQQQRVALARALMGKPQILFADEPTSSLDYDNREKFLQLVFALSKEVGTTVLFVSHDRTLEPLFDRSVSFRELNRAVERDLSRVDLNGGDLA